MKQIVLITDFGFDDIYLGLMKGEILSITSENNTIDLFHNLFPQNLEQSAFILSKVIDYFPQNVVYCCVVAPSSDSHRDIIIVQNGDSYFVAPNNGFLSGIITKESKIYYLEKKYFVKCVAKNYHFIISRICAEISLGNKDKVLGKNVVLDEIRVLEFSAIEYNDKVVGKIVNIDRFGNIITNLDSKWLDSFDFLQIGETLIKQKHLSYVNSPSNELFLYKGELDSIEIAIKYGNANSIINSNVGDEVIIKKGSK